MRCALVGCGYWGERVLCALCEPYTKELVALNPFSKEVLKQAEFTLVGVYDSNPINAQKAQTMYPHLHIYASFEALLTDSKIEAIFLITPPASHFSLAKAALESKKHIFVEKPLALSSQECTLLYELAKKQGVVLHCDHIFLYAPAVQWLKNNKQDFGDILSIQARRAGFGRFQKEVSVVWDLALHDITILEYVLGRDVLENMKPCARFIDVGGYRAIADVAFAHIPSHIDAFIHIYTSWLSPRKVREMVVIGTKCGVIYDETAESKLALFAMDLTYDNKKMMALSPLQLCASSATPCVNLQSKSFSSISPESIFTYPSLADTPPLIASIAHFYTQILQEQMCLELTQHTIRVVKILEQIDETSLCQEIVQAF